MMKKYRKTKTEQGMLELPTGSVKVSEPPGTGVCKGDTSDIGVSKSPKDQKNLSDKNNTRKKWTKEINVKVMECYYRSKPAEQGYRQRFHQLWEESNIMEVSEQRLCDQRRVIVNKEWLTSVELEKIKRRVVERAESKDEESDDENDMWFLGFDEEGKDVYIQECQVVLSDIEKRTKEYGDREAGQNQAKRDLKEEQKEIVNEIEKIIEKGEFGGMKPFKNIDQVKLNKITQKVNEVLVCIETKNITETNNLVRAVETYVAKEMGLKEKRKKEKKDPWWKRRIQNDIAKLRKEISIMDRYRKGELKRIYKVIEMEKKYSIRKKGLKVVLEELKQRVKAKASKIKRYDQRINQYRQNRMFQTSQKQFYKELNGEIRTEAITPDPEESKQFWGNIWDKEKEHNKAAEWLHDIKEEVNLNKQENIVITEQMVKKQSSKIPNWKAPGPEGVQGFWLKKLTKLHKRIAEQFNHLLENSERIPKWMTQGRTILCIKDVSKGNAAENFRPISCLPLMWKLLTGILAEELYGFLEENGLLPTEQKGCRRGSRGTKDQILIDKLVLQDCRKRHTNLSMAWIDYKKAYDMVPHSWIVECLEMCGIAENVNQFLKDSMRMWETELTANGEILGKVKIRRGIFQGDSLSPLLFVMCMIPMSMVLRKAKAGYEFKDRETKINHLLFMDDLKLYGKNEDQIDSLIQTVHTFSEDIGMEFGIKKCGVLVLQKGKVKQMHGIELPNGEVMKKIDEEGYKYLGIVEYDKIKESEMRSKFKKEYLRRIRLVLKSKLNGKNKIAGINTWAISMLRYGAGIIKWSKEDLQKLDRKTRKLMTMNGALHPKSDVDRVYLSRVEGGRGLISCEMCVRGEENNLGWYINNSVEPLLLKVKENKTIKTEGCMERKEYKKAVTAEKKEGWQVKEMHGKFVRELPNEIDIEKSWEWMRKADLKPETESLIFAAQENALRTNYVKFNIDKTADTPLCRMCKERVESVGHLVSECTKLAQKEYKRRHDNVARIIHWELCGIYGLQRQNKWYEHKPEGVIEDEKIKILWDFNIQCDHQIHHRRPDIVVIEKKSKTCQIIDIAVPGDKRAYSKENEKIENYEELRQELFKVWAMKKIEVIPVVIGALGIVTKRITNWIKKLGLKTRIGHLQKTALLGTARILRKVLQIKE